MGFVFAEKEKQKIGLSFINGFSMASDAELYKNPPFFPGFFVLKMQINESNIIHSVGFF